MDRGRVAKPVAFIALFLLAIAVSGAQEEDIYINDTEIAEERDFSHVIDTVSPEDLGISEVTESNTVVGQIGTEASFSHQTALDGIRRKSKDLREGIAYEALMEMLLDVMNGSKAVMDLERRLSVYEINSIYENVDTEAYRTRKTLLLDVDEPYYNVTVIEFLPGSVARNSSDVVFTGTEPEVLGNDPLVLAWHFDFVDESVNTTYYLKTIVVGTEGSQIFAAGSPLGGAPERREVGLDEEVEEEDTPGLIQRGLEIGYKFSENLIVISLALGLVIVLSIVVMEMEGRDMFKEVKNFYRDAEACARIGLKNHNIIDSYIRECLDQGYHLEDIRVSLMRAGWDRKAIRTLLKKYK